ncbi:MAG: flagellin [Candidatus Caenarcaniphilales bacterium]|nr:flagellin [Candidatus Caenarcaniphilales bacterium]
MVDRLSTKQIFNHFHSNILLNQELLINSSNKINSGNAFANNFEDPRANTLSLDFQGQILQNDQTITNRNNALTQVELAENALAGMKDNVDRLKEIAITATNATNDESVFRSYITELRSIGEAMIQLANTKSGEQYIFSGKQSNLTPFQLLDANDSFDLAVYKEGLDNERQKSTENIEYTFDIKDALIGQGRPAVIQGINLNPASAAGGNLDFVVNDGNGGEINFTANIPAAANMATIIANINTAYTTAGGVGAIAAEDPTYQIKLDTSLIGTSLTNAEARISIQDTSNQTVLSEIGFNNSSARGDDIGTLRIIAALETALEAGDQTTVQGLIKQIDENTTFLLDIRARMGLTIKRIQNLNEINDKLGNQLETALSRVKDADFVEANLQLNTAQSRLNSSIDTAASFFNSSLNNFLR